MGSIGLNPLLRALAKEHSALRIHLVGHSFGGRLVTATAADADAEAELGPTKS